MCHLNGRKKLYFSKLNVLDLIITVAGWCSYMYSYFNHGLLVSPNSTQLTFLVPALYIVVVTENDKKDQNQRTHYGSHASNGEGNHNMSS